VGQPILNLTQGPGPSRHFSGSQIRTQNSEIGTLVTVTTHITVDTGSTSFSVLIPAISLKATSDHQTFSTEAIVTSHSGPNSVRSTGVHEKYQFIPLQAEASFVLSLLAPVIGDLARTANP
jgi:flagellar motor switch protein FliM